MRKMEISKEEFNILWKRAFIIRLIVSFVGLAIAAINLYTEIKFITPIPCIFLSLIFLFYNILLINIVLPGLKPQHFLPFALFMAFLDGLFTTSLIYFTQEVL